MSKLPAVVVDLDGTVARRVPELRSDPYNMALVSLDEPIWPIIDLANLLVKAHAAKLLIVTARENTGNCYSDSWKWLTKHGVQPHQMFMRNEKDYRPDDQVKSEFYLTEIEPYYGVLYVLDDHRPVVDMWRSFDLTCLQVAKGWAE